jgi:uncharacterized protein
MFYTSFFIGFLGSLHCLGMCGPLLLMLPSDRHNQVKFVGGRLLYNIGRILTYSLLGLGIGLIGEQVSFFISQKAISLILGFLILTVLLMPNLWQRKLGTFSVVARLTNFVKSSLARLFKQHTFGIQFAFGMLNGLLPCGMVYAALSGAFLTHSLVGGMIFMALFGLGTMPMMLGIGLGSGWIRQHFGAYLNKVVPYTYTLIAVWLIIRGFNVPIPDIFHYGTDTSAIPVCH